MKAKDKIDLYKLHKNDYVASKRPVLLLIKKAAYLAIDGQGAPGGKNFTERIGALYSVAFTVKMTHKFAGKHDYAVCKLEAQWWADDDAAEFTLRPKEEWRWRFRTPEFIRKAELERAAAALVERGKSPTVKEVVLESFVEGRCVQMLHVGPYEAEHRTIALMRTHAEENGCSFRGRHHEVYLSDPRRVPPERLKTILRQPVAA